jgi:hypothetical protein
VSRGLERLEPDDHHTIGPISTPKWRASNRPIAQCNSALLRDRLAEIRAELDRLRALEADLVRLLERQPDPACPDMTAGAAARVVRRRRSRPLPAVGREVTTTPLLDCPCGPDSPCDDCPPGCC